MLVWVNMYILVLYDVLYIFYSLQDVRVVKDFNIEDRAGGVGREVVMNFTAEVTSHTLIIHFYWAGKGTTTVPSRGVYGPLISAITVTPSQTIKPSSSISHFFLGLN